MGCVWHAGGGHAARFNHQPRRTAHHHRGDRELAQFIYLLLNNARIREVIDTITSKTVLILGPFTPERKRTLNALRVFRTFACLNSVMLR